MRFVTIFASLAVATLAVVGCQNYRFNPSAPRARDNTGTSGSYTTPAAKPSATTPSTTPPSTSSDNPWQSMPSTLNTTPSDQGSSSSQGTGAGSSVDQGSTGTGSSVDLPSGVAPDATEYGTPATSEPSSQQPEQQPEQQPLQQPSSTFEQGSSSSTTQQQHQIPDTSRTMP